MSAAVESMMFVGKTPWHGLGNKVDSTITISEAIESAGLNWNVGLKIYKLLMVFPYLIVRRIVRTLETFWEL